MERTLAGAGEFAGCIGRLIAGVVLLAIYLVLLLLIWALLSALLGGDLWFQGAGGMPGTGEPTPVLGLVASASAMCIMGWSWSRLKRLRARVGLSRHERAPDDRRIPHDVLIAVLERANADGVASRSEAPDEAEAWLALSRGHLEVLVGGRRTWLVQARRTLRIPTATLAYRYPCAREQLDRVLDTIKPDGQSVLE
jgi:hypothetical protein